MEDEFGEGWLPSAPLPHAVSVSRIAHTARVYRSRVCALVLLSLCGESLIRGLRLRGPEPGTVPRRLCSWIRSLDEKMRRANGRHAARGTRRMTLERVRSGFLHIGTRVRSRLLVVWSELLTLAGQRIPQPADPAGGDEMVRRRVGFGSGSIHIRSIITCKSHLLASISARPPFTWLH